MKTKGVAGISLKYFTFLDVVHIYGCYRMVRIL